MSSESKVRILTAEYQGFQSKADLLWVSRGLRRVEDVVDGQQVRFLYYYVSELWGHRQKVRAGNGNTGTSEVGAMQANPL